MIQRTLYYSAEHGLLEWRQVTQRYRGIGSGRTYEVFPQSGGLVHVLSFYSDGEVTVEELERHLVPGGPEVPPEPTALFWPDREGDVWVKHNDKWTVLSHDYRDYTWDEVYREFGEPE